MGERRDERNASRRSFQRLARKQVVALSAAGLVLILTAAAALAVTGALTQPAGSAGCISETGSGPCADGHGLDGTGAVAVSPDGKSVYVTSRDSNAVVRLNRNPTTGAITQPAGSAGCISETGSGPCADGHGLTGAFDVAVSADGKTVYAASEDGNAVVRLNRNTTTGAITQPPGSAGCISETGSGPCADGHALVDGADSVKMTADGKSVYVASYPNSAVVRLNRNTTTGAISQPAGSAGCISETGSGPCANGHGLTNAVWLGLSHNGKNVYAASENGNAVVRLNRNTTTGAITQPAGSAGCISETGSGPCADGHAFDTPTWVAVSADGKSVYVASNVSKAVVRLDRNTTTGAISQPAGSAGCISETGSGPCADGHALLKPIAGDVSADGKSIYVASLNSDAVARFNRAP